MELTILLLKKIITLLLMMLMGFLLVKQGKVKSEDCSVLSKLNVDWVIPCMIINSFITDNNTELIQSFGLACVGVIISIFMCMGLTFLLRKPLHLNPSEQGSLMFSNSASMALPLAASLLGEQSVIYCSPHMGMQNLFIFTVVPMLMSEKSSFNIKILFNRNIFAILFGVFLFVTQIQLPGIITDTLATVGGVTGPLCMFMIGMLMGGVDFKRLFQKKTLYLICALRLIVYPLIAILLIWASGITRTLSYAGEVLMVVVMCVSCPAASLVTQLSDLYRSKEEARDTGSLNVMTTLLCSITMPIMIFIYQYLCM